MTLRSAHRLPLSEAARQAIILNALPAHVALLDGAGCIILVNDRWRNFADDNVLQGGRCRVGNNFLEICDSANGSDCAEAAQVVAGIRSVLAGTTRNFSIEYPSHAPTGQRWFLLAVTPLTDDGSDGAVVMHMDITERLQAQAAALQLGERLTSTLDSMSDAFYMVDRDWCFTFLNRQAELLLGRSREELLGKVLWSEFPQTAGLVLEREYRRALADNVTVAFEEFYGWLDAWFSVRAYPSSQGLAVYFTDISHKRRAADALRDSELEFRNLAEAMPQIVWITRPDGWNTYFNRQWSDYTGMSMAESLGQGWSRPIHTEDRERVAEAWRKAMETAGTYAVECRLRRADAVYRWWLIRGVPVRDAGGTVIKWFGTCTDIHDRKVTELEMVRINQGLRESELRVRLLNRVHAVHGQTNALLARKPDRDELFAESCRIAVELGQFRLAWIGLLDRESQLLTPVASAGEATHLLGLAPRQLFDARWLGRGGTGQAMRECKPHVVNSFKDDRQGPMFEQMESNGIHSCAVLPLVAGDEAIGMVALYAHEAGFFDEERMQLLQELGSNISLAIEKIQTQERLDYLAHYDPLTGLANRTLFIGRLSQHMRNADNLGQQLAVFLIDLERFKNVNDGLGRHAGDALLKQVTQWFVDRGGDVDLLARVGSNHFAAVLPRAPPDGEMVALIEQTRSALNSHPFAIDGTVLRVAARVGVALFPAHGDSAETLFQNAEAALKQAKADGDRHLFYSDTMTHSVAGRLDLENRLRRALDNQEFVLHYQPKVNLASGKVTGAEALIRWNDPENGLIPPGQFIPVLEETGLINEVGRWAMRKAVEDYLRWCEAGLPGVRIAVNVSSLQMRSREFVADVTRVLDIDPRAASGRELEITESMLMGDIDHGIASLKAIRALGVTIALDDFGTGFSSLSYLARLPIDTLKIDGSFIKAMDAAREGFALVAMITNLGHSLRHKVVAEGVETEEQYRLLRLLNCDEMQGFYFGKPVPSDVFEASYLVPAIQ